MEYNGIGGFFAGFALPGHVVISSMDVLTHLKLGRFLLCGQQPLPVVFVCKCCCLCADGGSWVAVPALVIFIGLLQVVISAVGI